jgi:hypothetical protein
MEIISWNFVAELHRRHPKRFTVIEMHPGGGMYDTIGFVQGKRVVANLNRPGSLHVGEPEISLLEFGEHSVWEVLLMDGGLTRVMDAFAKRLAWKRPKKRPPTSEETLANRCFKALLNRRLMEPGKWEVRNGCLDTSGFGGGPREEWFKAFPSANKARETRLPSDVLGVAEYRFFFLLRDESPQICIDKGGVLHRAGGRKPVPLMPAYKKLRSVAATLAAAGIVE